MACLAGEDKTAPKSYMVGLGQPRILFAFTQFTHFAAICYKHPQILSFCGSVQHCTPNTAKGFFFPKWMILGSETLNCRLHVFFF